MGSFVEVDVEVGGASVGCVRGFEVGLVLRELLLPDVWWVAEHCIKPRIFEWSAKPIKENIGKLQLPVKEVFLCGNFLCLLKKWLLSYL